MRPLTDALVDVLCGVAAYTLSRWLWNNPQGIWDNLPKELATFLGIFLLLRLIVSMWGRARRQRIEAERVARSIRNATPPAARR
jgi:hypothetical protein